MCPIISIIVPIYKSELFLSGCIDSVLSQQFQDFELILVDDGSPDKSGYICDLYAQRDSRIIVIHKLNTGANDSRIIGIKKSRGKYILFLDSDDFLPIYSLSSLYNSMISNNVDIVLGSIISESGNKIHITNNVIGDGIYDRITYLKALLIEDCYSGLHSKLYKRELFTKEVFCLPNDVSHHEDFFMNIMLALKINCVGVFNDLKAYRYSFQNQNSVSRGSIMTEHECNILFYLLKQKLDIYNLWNLCKEEYVNHLYTTIYYQFVLKNMRYKSYYILKYSLEFEPKKFDLLIEILNEHRFIRFGWLILLHIKSTIVSQLVWVKHIFERLF